MLVQRWGPCFSTSCRTRQSSFSPQGPFTTELLRLPPTDRIYTHTQKRQVAYSGGRGPLFLGAARLALALTRLVDVVAIVAVEQTLRRVRWNHVLFRWSLSQNFTTGSSSIWGQSERPRIFSGWLEGLLPWLVEVEFGKVLGILSSIGSLADRALRLGACDILGVFAGLALVFGF